MMQQEIVRDGRQQIKIGVYTYKGRPYATPTSGAGASCSGFNHYVAILLLCRVHTRTNVLCPDEWKVIECVIGSHPEVEGLHLKFWNVNKLIKME